MKLPAYPCGLFAVCLLFFASCEKKAESPRARESSEVSARDETAQGTATENTDDTSNSLMNERHDYLRLTLQNSTDGNIDETAILLGKHSFTFGIVGKGFSKDVVGWPYPVGTNAVVRWRDSGKANRESTVDFSGIYDRKVPGELMFTITTTNVTVKFTRIKFK
ncbi:MAG TPA: hypothetical protein VN887_17315 [Candidatus Angelobacter sp.]|nr:hypothetical protein [Candidatus Angelobacter sp.]